MAPVPPVLVQPSPQLPAAARQAMLALARAGDRLVAVGEQGIVLLSDDHGANWRQARVQVSVTLTAVRFADARRGWAVGHMGVVLATEDGGETWQTRLDGVTAAQRVLAEAEATARAATAGARERAERALEDARRLVEEGPDKPFLDVFFIDAQRGFVLGAYNLIFRTSDGGQSWQPWSARVPNPMGMHLYGMAATAEALFVVGEQGTLLRADLGGERFEALDSPYDGSFFGVVAMPDGAVVTFGLRGHAFRSDDGGDTWIELDSGQGESIAAGALLDDGRVMLSSQAGAVLVGADDGRRLMPLEGVPPLPLAAVAQAADGGLVAAGLMGVLRLNGLSDVAGSASR
ncbi:MAG: WD40/YVTN/BNR-like repeat-containing protein [Rhodocyclaceae bacterium]